MTSNIPQSPHVSYVPDAAGETPNINDLLRRVQESSDEDLPGKKRKYVHLSAEQFSVLMHCFQQQQSDISRLLTSSAQADTTDTSFSTDPSLPSNANASSNIKIKTTDHYNNAKYEDIICRPIKPTYDGSPDTLIPFLNRLDIRRQDETWKSITYISSEGKTYDIIRHFAKIPESVITANAKMRWTSDSVETDKYTFGHPTYLARCLARLLLCSITEDFYITVIGRIEQDYRNDGPLLLWTVCNNIYRNNIAFVETIKAKLRMANIDQFNNDIPKYITFLRDNLRLITAADDTTTDHNDLLTYIFNALSSSNITLFKEQVQKWHVSYLEAETPDLTPTKLIKMADDKIQVLRHAGLWNETENPNVMALKLELDQQKQNNKELVQQIVAHISRITDRSSKAQNGLNGYQHPAWMTTPPHSITEISKVMNGKSYVWCTKCRRGQGLWVATHNTETHQEGYRRNSFKNPRQDNRRQPYTPPQNPQQHPQQNGLYPPKYQIPPQPQVQLSLTDYIDTYFNTSEENPFMADQQNQPE